MNPSVSMATIPADRWERVFGKREPPGRDDVVRHITIGGPGVPLALPEGGFDMSDPDIDTRHGIDTVARELVAEGRFANHSDARARVEAARNRGDQIRANGNR